MQHESVIRNLIAEKGWKILSLEITPVIDTVKGKEGGIKLILDTYIPKCPNVKYIVVPSGISGQIKDGIIRTYIPRDILPLIRLLPSIMNHCSAVNGANNHCPKRFQCEMMTEFFRKVKSRELCYGLRNPFVGTAPFIIKDHETICSSFVSNGKQAL